MNNKELTERLHSWADDAAASKRGGATTMRIAAARLAALAEENERLRQLLWSAREMLECGDWKDAENGWTAQFVREQIEKAVPR